MLVGPTSGFPECVSKFRPCEPVVLPLPPVHGRNTVPGGGRGIFIISSKRAKQYNDFHTTIHAEGEH